MKFLAMWLNALLNDNGVSTTLSPREIVTRHKLDFTKHCRVRFGAYVKESADADVTNTIHERTQECIALGPTKNFQGSVACFDLENG